MSKWLKIGLALVLIGAGVTVAFGIVSGEGFGSLYNAEDYELRELIYSADEFTTLDISLDNKQVIILPSENNEIKLSFYESEKNRFTTEENGTTLEVVNQVEWFSNFLIGFSVFDYSTYGKFYLYLPTSQTYNILVDTSNGSITVDDLENFDKLTLKTSNGAVTLRNIFVLDSIFVDTSNGKILLTNVESDEINIDTSNGSINGTGIIANDFDCYTSNGPINVDVVGSFEDFYVDLSTTNGNMYIDGSEVVTHKYHTSLVNKVRLRTSNGTIRLNFSN